MHYIKYILTSLLIASPLFAFESEQLKLLEVDKLSMQYRDLRSFDRWKMRNPYLSPRDEDIRYGLALNFNWRPIQYGSYYTFWENEWAYYSEQTHVRDVYWDFKLGFTLVPDYVRVFYRHKSEHVLDEERTQKFPVLDEGVIEVIFINSK